MMRDKKFGLELVAALLLAVLLLQQQVADSLPWPLDALQSASSSSSSSHQTSRISVTRLRANRLRRPEFCRETLPKRAEDLPALVAIGSVKEVYLSNSSPLTDGGANNTATLGADSQNNRALVQLSRIIKGKKELLNGEIIVSGFNSSNPAHTQCPNFVKPNDTLIFLLDQLDQDRKFHVQGNNLLSMSLYNLDRINALAADEPFKRRPLIEDILCEKHYCAYGRCKIVDPDREEVRCECPDSCAPLPMPVCGSDNTTYTNECHLIREGCRQQRPLFVTKETSC